MTSRYKRTHTCGQLREQDQQAQVELCGWVYRSRNHGQLVFVDLRDRYGVTQIVFDPRIDAKAHELSQALRAEWVIHIQGKVRTREKSLINPKIATGTIEVEVEELNVLSMAATPPFELQDDYLHPNEELRLTYRYLDMRQAPVYKKLEMRHKICQQVRNYFNDQQFLEIHTPYLAKSTPEGARDYLVPSRVYPGKFFALPQSPQIFKQLLMVGGMDRYYQICPCFRDEDLRADRQPEFYQIDVEMSFAHPEDLFSLIENCFRSLFSDLLKKPLKTPFLHLSHQEAMESYGTDKPDLRFDMKLIRLDELLKESSFDLAKQELELGAISKAICVKGGASKLSRKHVDSLIGFVQGFGLSGLAWMKRSGAPSSEESSGLTGPLVKFFEGDLLEKLFEKMNLEEDDLLLVGFDREKTLNQAMDHLRRHVAKMMDLIDKSRFEFVWIVDFPLFQYDAVNRCLTAEHHPFCSPLPSDMEKLETHPLEVRANCYDLVLNGYELASGSQRIHDFALQKRIFEILKLSQEDIEERFGFFVRALQYGTPPHLGCALGLDRIVMILTETDNIRDVIAFPKTQNAADLMCESPSTIDSKQLQELKLAIKP